MIIPAYNAETSISDAVASALRQSGTNIEIVIADDNSSDNTLEVAQRLASEDERVRVLSSDANGGPGASRNRAIEAAHGEWVALLDADDLWLPGRLERLSALFDGADAVSDDVVIEEFGKRTRTLLGSSGFAVSGPVRLTAADLVRHGLGLLKPVVRRSFLAQHGIRFDPSLRIGEDFCFFVDLLLAGARWTQTGEAAYVYRRRPGSLTSGRREHLEGRLASDSALLARPPVRADPELTRLLEERVHWLRDLTRLFAVLELAGRRDWKAIARSVRAEPRLAPVLVRTGARHAYHVARWRLRAVRPGGSASH